MFGKPPAFATHPTLRTNDPPRCACVGEHAGIHGVLTGTGRALCTEHDADAITAAENAAEAARIRAAAQPFRDALAEINTPDPEAPAPDWRGVFCDLLDGGNTASSTAGTPTVALNDDDALASIVANALGAPVTRGAQ